MFRFMPNLSAAEINVLLERQDNLYQRKSELQSLLELCKETEDSVSKGTGTSTNSENWSGSFKWDSEADDIKLNIFGISSYRANQREVSSFIIIFLIYFLLFFFPYIVYISDSVVY